ncbi:hypothetical protein HZ326_30649 [Fusarium oxysporum f. sp. albedinis]|nr:hypothetical protein HZ326_30649 [Fusarium oxysporum f. sp. albedinis]
MIPCAAILLFNNISLLTIRLLWRNCLSRSHILRGYLRITFLSTAGFPGRDVYLAYCLRRPPCLLAGAI